MGIDRPWAPSRRAVGICVGVIVGVAGFEIMLAGRFGDAPSWMYLSDIGWAAIWTTCGLVAWRYRPGSRIGTLMLAMGAIFALYAPWSFRLPTEFPLRAAITFLGVLGFWMELALLAHLFVTFPSGRARSPFDKRFLIATYITAVACAGGTLIIYAPDPAYCRDRCGVNPFGFTVEGRIAQTVQTVADLCFALLAVAVLVILIGRLIAASPRKRRTLRFPLGTATFLLAVTAALFVTNAFGNLTPFALEYGAMWVAFVAVPVAFLWGLLRERLAFAGVGDLVGELGRVGPDQIQPGLAKVLADPGLRVLFPVGGGQFVDVNGNRVDPPTPDAARVVTRLGGETSPLAVLVHDPALLEHRELLDAAGSAAGLALENARLQAEVRAQLAEVRASRARLVDVADAERRQLERDLHDGAQQRLLGMGMTLQTLRGRLPVIDPGTDRLLREATAELRSALNELRDLAQGIHPAVLTDEGLIAAVGVLARRCQLPVTAQGELPERPPPAVEAAAYYAISEALQNTVKHAHAGHVTIRVHRDGDALVVDVADDGVGGARLDGGTGLRGLHDRITAIDGTLTLTSPPNEGTHLCARLPWT